MPRLPAQADLLGDQPERGVRMVEEDGMTGQIVLDPGLASLPPNVDHLPNQSIERYLVSTGIGAAMRVVLR
jgi:hypothetical protein